MNVTVEVPPLAAVIALSGAFLATPITSGAARSAKALATRRAFQRLLRRDNGYVCRSIGVIRTSFTMPLRDPTPDEARCLAASALGEEFARAALNYTAPLYWRSQTGKDGITNGTTFFLDCGQGPFGVTAGHVYDRFAAAAGGGTRCQIAFSPQQFDLRERLIARGRSVDIATYRVTSLELGLIEKVALTGWQAEWPPKPPQLERGLIFCGFPAADRSMIRPRVIEWGIYSGSGVADSVNDRDVSCVIDHQFMVPTYWASIPAVGHDLAGMSGGPVLTIVQNEVVGWRLAGVIYECGRNLLEVVKAARADFIRPDGTLSE